MTNQGEVIREIAYKKGLKQADLAELKGVTRQTISQELKKDKLGIESLKWYANTLNTTVEEIVNYKSDKNQQDSEEWKEKYFKALEKIEVLSNVIMQNGLKVNFKFVVSSPRVKDIFFIRTNMATNISGI